MAVHIVQRCAKRNRLASLRGCLGAALTVRFPCSSEHTVVGPVGCRLAVRLFPTGPLRFRAFVWTDVEKRRIFGYRRSDTVRQAPSRQWAKLNGMKRGTAKQIRALLGGNPVRAVSPAWFRGDCCASVGSRKEGPRSWRSRAKLFGSKRHFRHQKVASPRASPARQSPRHRAIVWHPRHRCV